MAIVTNTHTYTELQQKTDFFISTNLKLFIFVDNIFDVVFFGDDLSKNKLETNLKYDGMQFFPRDIV